MASYTEHPANRLGYLLVRILLHYPYVLFPVSLSITEQILKSYQDVKACQTSQITPHCPSYSSSYCFLLSGKHPS